LAVLHQAGRVWAATAAAASRAIAKGFHIEAALADQGGESFLVGIALADQVENIRRKAVLVEANAKGFHMATALAELTGEGFHRETARVGVSVECGHKAVLIGTNAECCHRGVALVGMTDLEDRIDKKLPQS